jgi:hypothetical protein
VLLLLHHLLLFVLKHNSRADLTNKAGIKASNPQVKLIGRRDHQPVQLNHLHTPPLGLNPRTFLWDPRVPEWAITTEESSAWGGGASSSSFPIITATATKVGLLVLCLVLCNRQASLLSFCASLCRPFVYQSCKSVSWGGRGPVQFGLLWSQPDQGWCSVVPN